MCFSLPWVEQVLIWLVVVCAVVALLRLLIGFVLPQLGIDGAILILVAQVIRIFIWAIVLIALIIFVFDLVSCLLPSMGGMPRIR
jgi:hypothetical protein